jgi:hypothetical protein
MSDESSKLKKSFLWPYYDTLSGFNPKHLTENHARAILPCRDGTEHFIRAFQSEHKENPAIWEKYRLESTCFLGELVILEDGDAFHIPTNPPPKASLSHRAFHQRRLYTNICTRNQNLLFDFCERFREEKHTYLLLKIAIRHFRNLNVRASKSYFVWGHSNMVVVHLPSRHIFHLEPLKYPTSKKILLTLEDWLGTFVIPRTGSKNQWILSSNLDFSTHLSLFPQKTRSLCRLWSWIMGLTVVLNGVGCTPSLVSVLQVFSHHTHVIFKIFMLFHSIVSPPSSCFDKCEEQNTLEKERQAIVNANLRVPPVLRPTIPVFYRETAYPQLLRAVEIDRPKSSLLLGLIN